MKRISLKKNKHKHSSIRTKLIWVFILASMIIFVINLVMYQRVNQTIRRIDTLYVSNVSLNELSDSLALVQDDVYEFLNTKSTDALNSYYIDTQTYRDLVGLLNDETSANSMLLLEKNIREMSNTYLSVTDDTIQAKRGRNVEKYKEDYEEAEDLFGYINDDIYTLNNMQFELNSDNYMVLQGSLQYMEIVSSVILICITIINVFIIIIWTRNVISPLITLSQKANAVSEGNFDVEYLPVTTDDEVGVVTKAFNKMLLSIREYIQKTKDNMDKEREMKEKELLMDSHLKDAQLKYLQAQINPHFLFNSLNAAAQLAMLEGAEKTCIFIEKMADFFRYNVKRVNEDVTLKEELLVVDNYMYIMNVRFSDDIKFKKKIDRRVLDVRFPSIVLQPIVENAVKHGIRDMEVDGEIILSISKRDKNICISIRDNGRGMTEDQIDKVMHGEPQSDEDRPDSTGIGMNNVISRLRLYYEKQDVIAIHSDGKDKGTEVMITIPYDNDIEEKADV